MLEMMCCIQQALWSALLHCAGMLLQSYSTVLYLTESGGPTVVLEQTVSSPLAQAAWLSWPQGNSLLCYPGNLLHGVIPGLLCNLLGWPARVIKPMLCRPALQT